MEQAKVSAKDFFLHLSNQVALYAVVISLVNVLFKIINKVYPKVGYGDYYYITNFGISFPISIIIIVFPVLVFINYLIEREFVINPISKQSWIRKWLSYITIFVSGIIVVGNLISVLYSYLDGQDLTNGFLLKVLAMFVISLLVFIYYIKDIKDRLSIQTKKIVACISVVFILATIILSFSIIGSPRTQRLTKIDDLKITHLMNLNMEINSYYQRNRSLPQRLQNLIENGSFYTIPLDPQTNEEYFYQIVQGVEYKLCAEFNFDYIDKKDKRYYQYSKGLNTQYEYGYDSYNREFWKYEEGKHCFNLKVPDYIVNTKS